MNFRTTSPRKCRFTNLKLEGYINLLWYFLTRRGKIWYTKKMHKEQEIWSWIIQFLISCISRIWLNYCTYYKNDDAKKTAKIKEEMVETGIVRDISLELFGVWITAVTSKYTLLSRVFSWFIVLYCNTLRGFVFLVAVTRYANSKIRMFLL